MPHSPIRPRVRWRDAVAAVLAWMTVASLTAAFAAPSAAPPAPAVPRRPDTLLVLSTSDLKGKTSPCGCHTPKGGFARREGYADSLRDDFGRVLVLNAGGWFPEGDTTYRDVAAFVAGEMVRGGTACSGVGERDLRYGLAFLRDVARASGLPLVSANLLDRATRRPLFPAWRTLSAAGVRVGVFSVMRARASLGPSADSLVVDDPVLAAKRAVDALRAAGATVVVALSDLGKVESEDLAGTVPGIDVVVASGDVPVLPNGRYVDRTVVVCGGDQGHYLVATRVALDPAGRGTSARSETIVMGPDIPEEPEAASRVKAFEDRFNDKLRRLEGVQAAAAAAAAGSGTEDMAEHYVGAELCARCHAEEYSQWTTTAHGRAWQTLVDIRKDATPDCVRCHVTGYQQPGGFQTGADAARLANVQCENCHGMGTDHDAWPAGRAPVSELICRRCHTEETSPQFDFAVFRPHILHQPPAVLPPLPPRPKSRALLMH